MKNFKYLLFLLSFICIHFTYSQQAEADIEIIHFNSNSTYSSGSGVSVHFDPKGIYKLGDESNLGVNDPENNSFILELSELGGSFNNPIQLETLHDFYTPLINSNLPSNLSSGNYKLRIRATFGYTGDPNAWSLDSNDYSEVVAETNFFEVQNQNINSEISITSSFPSNDNYINCLNDSDLPSPFIGSMSQSIGSTTAIVSTVNYLQFNINGYDNDNNYEITLYDYYNDSNQVLNQGAGPGFYEIPEDLEIGTYTIEVVETLPNDISNIISFSFLWHSNATALNNQTSESVCIGEDVIFSIPTNNDGIARNYFGSYYKVDFGDNTNIILTHNTILHQNSFYHQFVGASCNIEGSNLYEIEESLYNKYEDCDSYTINGEGAVKFVDASAPPAPEFSLDDQQCINPQAPENVELINTTQTGEWTSQNSLDCQTDLLSYWSVRPPGFSDFVSVNDFFPSWISDLNNDGLSDLDIPYSEIDDPGCWDFELVAINGNNVICSSTVVATGTIEMLELPEPSFILQDDEGNEISQICPGDVVNIIDTSNLSDVVEEDCQAVSYNWTISGAQYVNGTGTNTQNPSVIFNNPGIYEIHLSLGNGICPSVMFNVPDFIVQGTPSVNLNNANNGSNEVVCSDSLPYVVDFNSTFTPAYSTDPYTPTAFLWEISGDNDDYTFINSSDSASPYPIVQFNSFGCYTISNTVNGDCDNASNDSFTLSLTATPEVDFDFIDSIGNEVNQVCPGDIISLIDNSTVDGSGCQDVQYSWSINGTTNYNYETGNSSSQNPSVSFSDPGSYEITLQVNNGSCATDTLTQTINIEGTPSVNINPVGGDSEQICMDSSDIPHIIDFSSSYTPEYSDGVFTPANYSWEISGDNISASDYSFINSSSSSSIYPTIQFNSFGCYTITNTVSGNCGTSSSDSFTISIDQNPIANFEILNTLGQVVDQICPGDIVQLHDLSDVSADGCDSIEYQWGISALIPGTPAGHCVPAQASTWTDPSPYIEFTEPGIFEVTVQVTAGNCPVSTISQEIVVEGPPSVDINVNGPDSDQICLLDSELPYQINFANTYTPEYSDSVYTPSSYIWVISGDGVTADDYIFINSSTSELPIIQFNSFKDFTITTTVGGNCDVTASDEFLISFNQIPELSNNNMSQIICSGESTEEIIFDSNVAETNYSWSFTSANTYLSGYDQQGTGNFSVQDIINSNNISGQVEFSVTPSTSDCEGTPQIFTITVNPEPSIDNIEQEVCTGSGISITPTDGTIPAGTTYSWDAPTSSPSGVITVGNSGTDETTITESELLNSTNSPAVLTYTVTPTTPDGCTGDSFTVSVTVNPLGQVDNPGDQEFCNNDNISINFTTDNTGGDTTYLWTNTNSAIGLSNSGSGNINVTATNTTNDAITSTVTVTPSFEGCEGTPQIFTINVNPAPQLDDPNDQVIFTGESTTAVTLTSSVNGVTYSWSANEPTGNLIGLSQSSGTSNQIPSETLVNDTSGPIVLTYTITPILQGVDCDAIPEEYTITINPPVTMLSIDDQVVCNGDDVNVDFESANSGGSTTFEWTNDTPGIGLAASGSGDLPSFTAINNVLSPIVATVTVTPTFENGGISSEGDSQTFTITVNPSSQVDEVDNQVLCNGDDSDEIIFTTSNTSGTTTYSWVNDTPSIGLASSGTGDIASFAAVNNSTSPVTATITVTPTYTNEGISCDGPEETFTITVNPTAQVDDPQDQIICNGETTSVEFTTQNTGGTTTYAWTNDTPSIGLADLGTGNIASFAGVNEGTSPVVANLTVTPTFTENGISCTGPAETFTITVNPTGQVDAIDSQILCNADETAAIAFSTENTGGTTTYAWTNDTPSIGLASSGNGDIDSFNVVNNGNEPVTATVVVTPSFEGCTGPTETFTITVNPTAEMNDPVDMVVCDAEVTDIVEFTTNNTGGTTTYTWTNDSPAIGLAATGSGDLPSFTAINTGTEPIVATVEVTPLFTGDINCDGISQTFTITVNPSAQVDEPNDQVLCNGDSILVEFTTQNTIGNTTFSWTSDIDFGNGLAGSGNIDFNVVNNGTFPSIATVTVIPIIVNLGVSCSGPSQLFNVTVNGNIDPKPTISDYNGYQISCFEANDGFINLSPEGGTPNDSEPFYSYQWIGPNNFSSNDQNIENLEPGTYNLTISDSLNCSFEFEYEINEPDPLEIIVDEQSDVQCNGIFDGIISISPQGGAAPYTYEWTKDGVFFSDQQNINNLEPGIYVLFLNDANECGPISQIFEIVQPDPIEISLENSVDILCFGENTGSIDINVIGGTPEQISTGVSIYNYAWTGPNGYTSNDSDIFNLFAGIYSLTVTDSLGCQESFEVELVEPEDLIINFETTDNTCYESNDGTITLDIQGGVEPYQIFWSNFGNGPTQTNLSAGIYEVTVIDAHDCEEITNIEIIEAPIFDTDPVSTDISCFGANDGSINLNIIGGIEPVFVTWDDDTTAGEERNNLLPGTYNVIIQDSSGNNCFITHEFIIIEPQELSLSSIIENAIDCENVNSGSIDLQVTGGTAPYTFQWNSGQITEDLENIAPGNYSVVVIDSKGCEVTDSFSIYRQEDFETSLDISFEADCENDIPYQITTINIEGGVAPYEIIWSSGDVSGDNNETMTSSQNGTVIVDVTDSIGCQTQVIFDIDLFTLGSPGFEYSSPGLTECEALGVGDLIQFTNTSTGDFISVDWNFGDNGLTVINEENPTHVYSQSGTYVVTQTVYYEYGCVDVFEEILYVTEGYALVLPNAFTPNGDGINDTIRPWFKCMTNVEISIYDTFGSLLYVESGDDIYGWNGLINGQMAENGNYIVVVKATTLFGEIINLNGPITLIR